MSENICHHGRNSGWVSHRALRCLDTDSAQVLRGEGDFIPFHIEVTQPDPDGVLRAR